LSRLEPAFRRKHAGKPTIRPLGFDETAAMMSAPGDAAHVLDQVHTEALAAILGPGGLILGPADRAAYETPARYAGGVAAAVARPASTEQVSQVVAYCVGHGLAFVPQGANTGLAEGSTPDPSGTQLVLSLDRLAAPLEIDAADRTATVGAGVRLSALNAALAPHGLFLPIDLGADPSLGGMAATNTGGARFLRYGDMRRHVLGLEVVVADAAGTVLTLSHGLRKDNAALALRQLFVGGCGALGIITKVTVEVHHRPRQTAAALLVPRDAEAVLPLLLAFEAEAGGDPHGVRGHVEGGDGPRHRPPAVAGQPVRRRGSGLCRAGRADPRLGPARRRGVAGRGAAADRRRPAGARRRPAGRRAVRARGPDVGPAP
jgi:FAD/FMN-containing dehydrogenase